MEITFIYPYYLWFLVSIPILIVLHLVTVKFTKRRALLFANFEAIKRVGTGVIHGRILSRNLLLLILRIFTLILLIFALAGTVVWHYGKSSDFDFVLAIDASGSMLADDFKPNRLGAAKNAAIKFVDAIVKNTHVGVISFSGTPFIKQRITKDLDKVKEAIKSINIEFASGTAIGDAIIAASNLLIDKERAKIIVLLTDGQSNVGTLVEEAIKYANDNHITIYTIGVATKSGGKFAEIKAISKLDETLLMNIAKLTGGEYYRAEDEKELDNAYKKIATTAKKKIPVKLTVPFLFIALSLILFEWFLINTKYRTIP